MDQVTIVVPSSSANVGLGYDIWCLGLARPQLRVTCTRQPARVELKPLPQSRFSPPEGRRLGHGGAVALRRFLKERDIHEGVRLSYEDVGYPHEGYPVGGLGRSGAEAVGAVMAAAVLFETRLSRDEVVFAAAKGEPGQHRDNVAASTNGGFNIIVTSPNTTRPSIDVYQAPDDLGIAIGYSSHKKIGGTERLRRVLGRPVPARDFVAQGGLLSAATAALVTGDTARFLELVWGDRFHEPRRADARGYGTFNAADLAALKRELFQDFQVALNISGAGPNIQLLYSKGEHPDGMGGAVSAAVLSWFEHRGMEMTIQATEIARQGAYDYARREYGY